MSEWQPIESAPKDGTEVLVIGTYHNMLYSQPEMIVAQYKRGWWSHRSVISHVTHWMPLPEFPGK